MWYRPGVMKLGPRVTPWCSLGCFAWALGCGGPQEPTALPASHVEAATTVREDERPPLTIVRREGDPRPALAVAIAHDAGPSYNRELGRALTAGLAQAGLEARTTLFTRGLVVSATLDSRGLPPGLDLRRRVMEAGEAASRAMAKPPRTTSALTLDPCDPVPVFAEEPPELGFQNVSLALVGSEQVVRGLAATLSGGEEWPTGDLPTTASPERDAYVSAHAAQSEVSIAVLTPAASRLLGAHARLSESPLLGDLVQAFPPHFHTKDISVGLGPRSSCLSLRLETEEELERDQAARLVVAVAELVQSQLEDAPQASRLLPAVLSSSAQASAEHAAWQALGGPEPEAASPVMVAVMRSPKLRSSEALADAEFERAIQQARARKTLALETRVEAGQGRVWASLESACPVAHETRDNAGFTSVALENAARSLSPDLLESYAGFGGPALVAHVPLLGDEPPELVADALATGLLRSLESSTEVNTIARERRDALVATKLVEFATELATHGRPSQVLSAGTHDSLSRISPNAVRTALVDFLASPLSLVVIANRDAAQGKRIAERLERLLSPFLAEGARCPETTEAAVAGRFELSLESSGASMVLAYPIPLQQLPAARAVAFLLSHKDGFLDRALVAPGLVARAAAAATGTTGGSAALFIAIEAEPETLDGAEAQVRALMQRVAGGAILEQHHRAVSAAWQPPPSTTPLARLFVDPTLQAAPSLDALRRFAHSYLTEEKLVLVRAHREP